MAKNMKSTTASCILMVFLVLIVLPIGGDALDAALAEAEKSKKVIKVNQDGSGEFKTVTEALKSIPKYNKERVVISIGPGEYVEKITVDKPFITFYGSPQNMPTLSFDGTAHEYGTVDSASVMVLANYFVAVNIIMKNSAPIPTGKFRFNGGQAVAMRVSGDKAAFYNCRFIGFQDTLLAYKGRHYFKDCYVEGTVDFVFGGGKTLFMNTEIRSVSNELVMIVAQARKNASEDNGFSFVHCNVTGTGDIYLGRPWFPYGRIIFAFTELCAQVNPLGWHEGAVPTTNVYFVEYKNTGPGSNIDKRPAWVKTKLTDAEVQPFLSTAFINGDDWLTPLPSL
ncbi:PREDICTED: pectinesterase PPME1-like [Nelumbo nucifera]|uniref:Pectinesterase n=1 Tax=Nelumbo nucifera TaxID=4432 RepID=A0A1U8AD85_NELNU|nr:PREDICTED: pectinesterase PPME1-like [Nelumbo nucifera]